MCVLSIGDPPRTFVGGCKRFAWKLDIFVVRCKESRNAKVKNATSEGEFSRSDQARSDTRFKLFSICSMIHLDSLGVRR